MTVRIGDMQAAAARKEAAQIGLFGGMGRFSWSESHPMQILARAISLRFTTTPQERGSDGATGAPITIYNSNTGAGQWGAGILTEPLVPRDRAKAILEEREQALLSQVYIAALLDTPCFGTMEDDPNDPNYRYSVAYALKMNPNRMAIIYVELNPDPTQFLAEALHQAKVQVLKNNNIPVMDAQRMEEYAAGIEIPPELSPEMRRQYIVDHLAAQITLSPDEIAAAQTKAAADYEKSVRQRLEFVKRIRKMQAGGRTQILLIVAENGGNREQVLTKIIPEMAMAGLAFAAAVQAEAHARAALNAARDDRHALADAIAATWPQDAGAEPSEPGKGAASDGRAG